MIADTHFELSEVTKKLPKHLYKFIVKQSYDDYTAQNQSVWRYVMRMNVNCLNKVAHSSYIDGLTKMGISTESIPSMESINRVLKEIGWATVFVDGFIPINAFMEFQAYNVLAIASNIRTTEHIGCTLIPDIIHEVAGHAPTVVNPEYAEYLRRFAEIGAKAISSAKDYELYEAIRSLSVLKQDPNSTEEEIEKAKENLVFLQDNMGEPSEMARIRNLYWWTVECGLIGKLNNPKVYGAGLLSSIGKNKSCLLYDVEKLPYTITAADISFDIAKPQSQLFVASNFAQLSSVLEEFANTMALRKGGLKGVEKLIDSNSLGTVELSSGLQISGVFTNAVKCKKGSLIYLQTKGNTALAYRDKELVGHGIKYHVEGFGSPVGKLKAINLPIEEMTPHDLEAYGIYEGNYIELDFEAGLRVEGEIITGTRNLKGQIILISFKNCTVTYYDQILFKPDWGIYDMAVGAKVISAYAGSADTSSFEEIGKIEEIKTHKIEYSEKDKELHKLYYEVRLMREKNTATDKNISQVFDTLLKNFSDDWLLPLELYELTTEEFTVRPYILKHLESLKINKNCQKLIENGLDLLNEKNRTNGII